MTLCGHCGSTSFDDLRGNCSCCGAPRPAAEYKEWRCVEPPEHVNAKCELAPSLAEMEWTRYRAPRSFYYDAGGPTAIDLIEEIACLGDANRG